MVDLLLDGALLLLVIGVALWTIRAEDDFAAVIGYVGYGMLLTLVWTRLAAYDIALTEAAIGSGVTGVILMRVAARLKSVPRGRPPIRARLIVGALSALIAAGLAAVVLLPLHPAPSLAESVRAHLPATGLGNPVAAVLMAYRAADTLLETVVVLLALFGVWSLGADERWRGRPTAASAGEADGALTLFTRLLVPIGIVIAIYIVWVGATQPGGKFQGATLLAAMWILAATAGLVETPRIDQPRLRWLLAAGPITFLLVGLAGIPLAGAFLAYPPSLAKPLILIIEFPLTLSIAAMLALIVVGPPEHPP